MRESLPQKVARYIREHIRYKRWRRAVTAMASVVVFCTTYALILPAITAADTTYCGIEEHTHTDECYEEELTCGYEEGSTEGTTVHHHSADCYTLTCGLEEGSSSAVLHEHTSDCYIRKLVEACGNHVHSEDCYDEYGNLTCGKEESYGHEHVKSCYDAYGNLVCGEEETAAHYHSAECYDENGNLICGQVETDGHTHSWGCFESAQVLICGMTEGEAEPGTETEGHTHTSDCYTLTCGYTEGEEIAASDETTGHVHTEECYTKKLICEKQEHSHTLSCYSNPNADLETAEIWERTIPDDLDEEDIRANIVAVAQSQLGYTESTSNYVVDEDFSIRGYTRYGAWYGAPYDHWCAMFVSFCLNYSGVSSEDFPYGGNCAKWIERLTEEDLYVEASEDYEPQAGDIIFFDNDENGKADHVGIVTDGHYEDGLDVLIKTIEGNSSDRVEENRYESTDSHILGYGVIPEDLIKKDAESENTDTTDINTVQQCKDSQGITYSYDTESGTAKIVSVPADLETAIIPETITPDGETAYTITDIGANALSGAAALQHITFITPEKITIIGVNGLANCPTLISVNSLTNVDEVKALFYNATIGYGAFDNTGFTSVSSDAAESDETADGENANAANSVTISDAGLTVTRDGAANLTVKGEGENGLTWKTDADGNGNGGYTLTNGEKLTLTASVDGSAVTTEETEAESETEESETEETASYIYHLYIKKGNASIDLEPGQEYTYDGIAVTCTQVLDSDVIELTFTPGEGTISIPITISGKSTDESSCGIKVWGEILSADEAEEDVSLSAENLAFYWLEKEEETVEEVTYPYSISYEGDGYTITLGWEEEGTLPEGTEVQVSEISGESDEYTTYTDQLLEKLTEEEKLSEGHELTYAKLYDITLMNNGEKVEPTAPVTINIKYNENVLQYAADFGAVHYTDDGIELIEAEAVKNGDEASSVTYQQGSFSVTGIYGLGSPNADSADENSRISGASQATVTLAWSDGTSGHSAFTVTLLKDGEAVETAELNTTNEFKYTFTGLDSTAEYSIQYTAVDGYTFSEKSETVNGTTWTKASTLSSNNTYVLVYSNTSTVQSTESGTLSQGTVTVSGDTITGVTEAMEWLYNGSTMQNVSTSEYLTVTGSFMSSDHPWETSSSGTRITYSNGKISGSYSGTFGSTTCYMENYGSSSSTSSGGGTSYTLYQGVTAKEMQFTITAQKSGSSSGDSGEVKFEHNKTIDYLGDGVTNSDTSVTGEENYRLYLDMLGAQEPIDLLVVVDASASMSKYNLTYNGTSMSRASAVSMFLNGSTSKATDDGFISYFLQVNSENKIAVINFKGSTSYNGSSGWSGSSLVSSSYPGYTADSSTLVNWTSSVTYANCSADSNSGTNYEAGLKMATSMFQDSAVANDGHKKFMIFLSDGCPTYFIIDSNDVGKYSNSSMTTSNVGQRYGTGEIEYYSKCTEPSKTAFDDFKSANPGVTVFTIGVSSDINSTDTSSSSSPTVLKYMAEQGGGEYIGITDDMTELKNTLITKFLPKDVTITDQLSKYVRLNSTNPDYKVTMTNISTGAVTVLYENGENKGVTSTGGKAAFNSIDYTAGDTSDTPTASTGTVTAKFGSEYTFDPRYRYTLSFNVVVTQTAKNEYTANEESYGGTKGDANTDYGTNATSSNKDGFYSNDSASVYYNADGAYFTEYYSKPVVQVTNTGTVDPVVPEYTGKFDHNKTIDYLGDGVENPDTTVTGDNEYRLYLDMTGKQEPIDLLIVVDTSGSMQSNKDISYNGTTMRRDYAVNMFLNGTTSGTSSTSDGFISYFLTANSANKVSVVKFSGVASGFKDYTSDSSVVMDWTSSVQSANCTATYNTGTDYDAGLKRAVDQFNKVKDDGNKKFMIFLSDGCPTFFIVDSNDKTLYSSLLSRYSVGDRFGTGSVSGSNYSNCKAPSQTAFDDFQTATKEMGIEVYTIGVSKDINTTDTGTSTSPDVLKYMAEKGGGEYIGITADMTDLKETLITKFLPKDVTITDQLSKYVKLNETNPDYKVTMTNIETGEVTVLYENGENKGVVSSSTKTPALESVTYTAGDTSETPTSSTGTVTAKFGEKYCFDPRYRYTLSFNVTLTQTAIDEYKANNGAYSGSVGDEGTDYGTNTTSSLKEGFFANTSADVYYFADTSYNREYYDRPVVQAKYIVGYELPETGGVGTTLYTIGGTALIAGSLLCGFILWRRRERRYR